jgi:hypothetical protein
MARQKTAARPASALFIVSSLIVSLFRRMDAWPLTIAKRPSTRQEFQGLADSVTGA